MKTKNYKNFLLLRPLINDMIEGEFNIPIIKKTEIDNNDFKKIKLSRINNLKSTTDRSYTILEMFNFDEILESLRNDPLKYSSKFHNFYAICSPDFSVYPDMNINCVKFNIYKSRRLGAYWQSCGYKVIPTVSRCLPDTYDVCFSGIEKHSIIIISTLGVKKNFKIFIEGFNEMKKRLEPSLIIVVGKIYDEMKGNFLHFDYEETFSNKKIFEQLLLFEISNYIERNEGGINDGK